MNYVSCSGSTRRPP